MSNSLPDLGALARVAPDRLGRSSLAVLAAIARSKGPDTAGTIGRLYEDVRAWEAEARLHRKNLGYVPDVVDSKLHAVRATAKAAFRLAMAPAGKAAGVRWVGIRRNHVGRICAWAHPELPVQVWHCGHPTALRPYYIRGVDVDRKFRLLADAQQAAVDALAAAGAAA